jgi:hypothetical protein
MAKRAEQIGDHLAAAVNSQTDATGLKARLRCILAVMGRAHWRLCIYWNLLWLGVSWKPLWLGVSWKPLWLGVSWISLWLAVSWILWRFVVSWKLWWLWQRVIVGGVAHLELLCPVKQVKLGQQMNATDNFKEILMTHAWSLSAKNYKSISGIIQLSNRRNSFWI